MGEFDKIRCESDPDPHVSVEKTMQWDERRDLIKSNTGSILLTQAFVNK